MSPRLHHVELRRAADAAARQCRGDRGRLDAAVARLRIRAGRHAPAWLLGGGFATGMLAARLPVAALLGAARFVVDAAVFVRRLPFGPPAVPRATPERPA